MSNKIEREIVQMVFEAKDFRKGIAESIESIDDLKDSFDLKNAQSSLGELQKASHLDFSAMSQSLDSINSKLGIFGVTAATVVSNVASAVMNAAKSMADTLILTPLKTGLEEYETQLNAIQTILANTANSTHCISNAATSLEFLLTNQDQAATV